MLHMGCTFRGKWTHEARRVIDVFRIPMREKRADERTRTADLLITSELLYLLSYVGLPGVQGISWQMCTLKRLWLMLDPPGVAYYYRS
jgi:hypothetical protein